MTAETVLFFAGIIGFTFILQWVRKRDLREKYALGWLFVAGLFLLFCIFPQALIGFAKWAKLSNASAALLGAAAFLLFFCFSVSVSLSRSFRMNKTLVQELALQEKRIRDLEDQMNNPNYSD